MAVGFAVLGEMEIVDEMSELREAVIKVRNALLTDNAIYEAFVSSIEGALRETTIVWEDWEYNEAARKIANRIIDKAD